MCAFECSRPHPCAFTRLNPSLPFEFLGYVSGQYLEIEPDVELDEGMVAPPPAAAHALGGVAPQTCPATDLPQLSVSPRLAVCPRLLGGYDKGCSSCEPPAQAAVLTLAAVARACACLIITRAGSWRAGSPKRCLLRRLHGALPLTPH